MIEHFSSPEDYLQAMSDNGIRVMVKQYLHLQKQGVLPPDSLFEKINTEICEWLKQPYNISILAGMLQTEVYRRFLEQNPNFK